MTEFIKVCAVIGLFTVYIAITGTPGVMVYNWLKEEKQETRLWKGLLTSYGIGIIIAVIMGAYFMIY